MAEPPAFDPEPDALASPRRRVVRPAGATGRTATVVALADAGSVALGVMQGRPRVPERGGPGADRSQGHDVIPFKRPEGRRPSVDWVDQSDAFWRDRFAHLHDLLNGDRAMTDTTVRPKTHDIVIEEVLPHAPATIWRVLTTGELVGRWLMAPAGFEAAEGREFTFQTTPAGRWDGVIHCRVLEVEPERRLAFTWTGGHDDNADYGSRLETVVSFTLEPVGAETRLRLVHAGFALPRNAATFTKMAEGWRTRPGAIGAVAAELH